MRTSVHVIAVTAGTWLGTLPPTIQARQPDAPAELRAAMKTALEEEGLVGVVWATVMPHAIATGGVGRANAAREEPLTAESKVLTGSIAKTFIAAGILRLVTEGRLKLDDRVESLLPQVTFNNPWASSDPVLLRHLLDHTSGLDDARLRQVFSLNATPDAPLNTSIQPGQLRIRSRPGSRLSYSNLGYTLLGMVIEHVTGERYERYLDAHLLHVLDMRHSTFRFVSQEGPQADPRLAMGHFESGVRQPAVPVHLRPSGQFTTTALDMARFARFLMSDGEVDGEVFIAARLLRAMGRPTTTDAASAGLAAGYGLGLNNRDRHGVLANCHTGTTVGFRSTLCLFPEEQKAFFVAMNADVETANYDRFDALLVRELGIAAATPASTRAPPSGMSDWQGVYVLAPNRMESFAYLDRVLNFATVRWDGRHLQLNPFQGTTRSLSPVGGWLFRAEDRTFASHVLLVSRDSRRVISDGFRSYEQISLWRMLPLWISLAAGLGGLAYLILLGIVRVLRRRLSHADPLFIPFLAAVALFLPAPFFLGQSFLQLGDLTPASGLLAFVTGMLPLAMLVGLFRSIGRSAVRRGVSWDGLAMLGVLQWSVVLSFWGLVPLRLWA